MKKSLYTLMAAVAFSWQANAQIAITADVINGTPLVTKNHTDIEGSPYLFDDWVWGEVKLVNGVIYPNIPLKFDALTGQVIFKGKDNQPYMFLHQVAEFILHNEKELVPFVFRNGFPAIDKNTPKTFYQVLANGEVQLLKRTHKSFTESTPYGYVKTVRTILSTDLYYIQKGGKMYKVKRDAKTLQAILTDQTITEYIRKNNLNISSDGDLIQAINYYNRKN